MRNAIYSIMAMLFSATMAAAQTPAASGETARTPRASSVPAAVEQRLVALEKQAWEAFKAKDAAAFKKVLSADAISIDASGMATTEQLTQVMKDYDLTEFSLTDFKVTRLGGRLMLLTYAARVKATYKGEAMPDKPIYSSSIYARRGGAWIAIFHQESMGS
ncbi:MAG: nuclear transport factor 2 family protein [Acidobacteria bacterium]|nr:nuclear transport factor 2 family protein [Acidobacteriota bacterium]